MSSDTVNTNICFVSELNQRPRSLIYTRSSATAHMAVISNALLLVAAAKSRAASCSRKNNVFLGVCLKGAQSVLTGSLTWSGKLEIMVGKKISRSRVGPGLGSYVSVTGGLEIFRRLKTHH